MATSRADVNLGEIKLSYFLLGKGDKEIILLHGWGTSKEKLLSLGEFLEKRGWRVLIPDLPGFGDSSLPSKSWDLSEYSKSILKLIDNFWPNRKVYVFGHSFGGRVAIKLAGLYPEKIMGTILCGSAGISRANILKRLSFLLLAKTGKVVSPKSEKLRQLIYKLAREHDYEKTEGVMRETFKLVIDENLKPLLSKIKAPTLVIWGKEDKMTKHTDAIIINSKIKKSKLISFSGQGHQLPYQEPEKLAEQITKWAKVK
jgi:pimeloyl-ACP methyl ester carboxylesterase